MAAPSSGDPTEHPAAAAAIRPAPGHNTERAAPARGEATGPSQPVDLLHILQQMEQQQIQQQQMLAILMQQLPAPGARPRPGHRDMVSPPPLHSTQPARSSLQASDPPRAAPRPPRAPDICRQYKDQEAHICLHSNAPSDQIGGSVGIQCHSEGPDPTGAAPQLPPAVPQQPCHVG